MYYFFSKKAIPNYAVWMITLLSSYVMKISDLGKSKVLVYYFISESVLWLILGVFLTVIIQFGLEKFTENKTLFFMILYLILLLFIASILFDLIFWPVIDVLHEFFLKKASYHGKFATNIFNWINWVVWFVCFTALNLYKEVEQEKIKNIELQNTIKESQLNALKAQINPHFMFNSLNNIRGLILEDVNKARKALTSLSELLRYTLSQNTISTIVLEAELEIVEKYVELSKIQFENRLLFTKKIDKNSLQVLIPPMLIQLLVENAVKHGISNLKKGGEIHLSIIIQEENLHINVVNSGRIKQNQVNLQLGIENIKKRLNLLYGKQAFFNLQEEKNKVIATVKIPIL